MNNAESLVSKVLSIHTHEYYTTTMLDHKKAGTMD